MAIQRPVIKGERHHWWPKSLSKNWTDSRSHIHRIDPNGNISEPSPTSLARISDGHNVVFGESSPWDSTFEQYFDRPDGNFPRLVSWLSEIVESHSTDSGALIEQEFCPHTCDDDELLRLFECMLSLAIRSPSFRTGAIDFAEGLRGPLPKRERKRLAAANLGQSYSILANNLSADGKYVVYFSESREFIYGDGFYQNLHVGSQNLFGAKMLLPITPRIAVLHARPMRYNPVPRLMTRNADPDLVALFNETVQIYSKECLFYRSDEPRLSKHFQSGQYLRFDSHDPIGELIQSIPGIPSQSNDLAF